MFVGILSLRGPGRGVAFFLPSGDWSLAFPAIAPGPIELLKQRTKVIKRGMLIKAEELFFFDLFIGEGILAEGGFKVAVAIEKV